MHARELGIDSVQDILTDVLSLEGETHGDEYNMKCPHPRHLDSNPSCSVNLESGYWHCFSCGVGGDLIELASLLMDIPRKRALQSLKPQSRDALRVIINRRLQQAVERPRMKHPIGLSLPGPYYDGPLTDLRNRGFTQDTLIKWGVRYVASEVLEGKKGEFKIEQSIAIPVRDADGHLLCWCYRRTDSSPGWQPKYLYTPGVEVSEIWFGLQHNAKARQVAIVEGALDTMWLDQCGYTALGLLGSHMGDRKILELQRFERIVLFPDRDSAGATWMTRIGNLLGERMPVSVVQYPSWAPGGDPQELHPIDVEIALERAIPWLRHRQRVLLLSRGEGVS